MSRTEEMEALTAEDVLLKKVGMVDCEGEAGSVGLGGMGR